jgi:hypothetical protein
VLKTLEQFNWSWPKKINRPQIQNLFRLAFLENHANEAFSEPPMAGRQRGELAELTR